MDYSVLKQGQRAGCCQNGSEPLALRYEGEISEKHRQLGSKLHRWEALTLGAKRVAFVDQLSDCQLLSMVSLTYCSASDVQFCC